MKLLKCIVCAGEVDLVGEEHSINRKVKCRKCGFTNEVENKGPEVVVIRKRPVQ
jgi:DNA-directed RNA polymerase subunit RPC12/RpoP